MKNHLSKSLLGLIVAATFLLAQGRLHATTAAAPQSNPQLDQLLSPIALYPDPLLALILPASTVPQDIAAASSFLDASADISTVDNQPWDASVKALTHYPDVLRWLNQNPSWVSAVGSQ